MYNPAAFRENRPDVLESFLAHHPFATLLTTTAQGIEASHVPLLFHRDEHGQGCLQGHVARANPQWRADPHTPALAIFHGPQHYISPNWYPSKSEHGKVVPTWNYVAVHVRGTLTIHDNRDWLLENVRALTASQEAAQPSPWRVADAPPEFIDLMLGAIVGIELKIAEWEGKWKVSQNRSSADREGVVAGLHNLDSPAAGAMAELVRAALMVT